MTNQGGAAGTFVAVVDGSGAGFGVAIAGAVVLIDGGIAVGFGVVVMFVSGCVGMPWVVIGFGEET
jgi:hypothetical protein